MGTPSAPPAIHGLIAKFHAHASHYRSHAYNEEQTRHDFINPFFEALGWDIANTAGYADAYRDVVLEQTLHIAGSSNAPDYSFRIGGQRKFFVEAKKPGTNLKDAIHPAYQLRRYAWSAKLPLSILTDFEEFAVYDTRIPPKNLEKASTARVLYCTFEHYPEKWDEIAALFSKDAVLKGSFDAYAQSTRRKGTTPFDDAFLEEIETWRKKLAENIALRNPSLSARDLNFSTQRIIDRIIFLRICEDRGIEPVAQLQSLLNGDNVYPRLQTLFRNADDRYNSGLFHFRKELPRRARRHLAPTHAPAKKRRPMLLNFADPNDSLTAEWNGPRKKRLVCCTFYCLDFWQPGCFSV